MHDTVENSDSGLHGCLTGIFACIANCLIFWGLLNLSKNTAIDPFIITAFLLLIELFAGLILLVTRKARGLGKALLFGLIYTGGL